MSSSLSAIQLKKPQAPAAAVENETSPVPPMLNDGPNPDQTCTQVKVHSNTFIYGGVLLLKWTNAYVALYWLLKAR